MSNIQVLDKVVADQIAAGEVVERPASVVKELLENALDAGATAILVEIDGGGAGRIRVLDNGSGFPDGQVERAFLRHATSKITAINDLDGIGTFGFRGEALASIASVAKVVVHTRQATAVAGTRLEINGGEVVSVRAAGCPVGTDFEVRDLFYNVPARLKFLKKESTEGSHCIEAVARMALVRPDVAFKVLSKGRTVRNFLAVARPEERVKTLFPKEPLALGRGEENGVVATAILGAPERARAGTGSLYTYVNGRFVRDTTIIRAVSQGFSGLLQNGRYPAGVVMVELSPSAVDVNVHPQKTEVRFANNQSVFAVVSHVVSTMAARSPWTRQVAQSTMTDRPGPKPQLLPEPQLPADEVGGVTGAPKGNVTRETEVVYSHDNGSAKVSVPQAGRVGPRPVQSAANLFSPVGELSNLKRDAGAGMPAAPMAASETRRFSDMRYIGPGGDTFLLLDDGSDLVVVDQHAAHERVNYEMLRKQYEAGAVSTQRLLSPHQVVLGPVEADRIEQMAEDLSKLGLEVERTGEDRVTVYGVPAQAAGGHPDRLLAEMVLALEEGRRGSRGSGDDLALATIACHGSIRAGRKVDRREVNALMEQMDNIDFAGHCPHGRPVLARFPWAEIRHRVGRG